MKADQVHYLVHQEGRPGHVSGIFENGQEEKQDDDVRQECQHGAYSLKNSVSEHAGEPSGTHNAAQPCAEGIDPGFNPSLRVGTDGECALEYCQKNQYQQRESEPFAGQQSVNSHRKGMVGTVAAV